MKTKLFISIVAVISALSIASAVADQIDNASVEYAPENSYCEIVLDWEKVLC